MAGDAPMPRKEEESPLSTEPRVPEATSEEGRALTEAQVESATLERLGEQTRKVLATLTPREEQVLRMRFGIGQKTEYTLQEVAQQFGVTAERIRQIEAKALRKLTQTLVS